jgi:hypothetical protein
VSAEFIENESGTSLIINDTEIISYSAEYLTDDFGGEKLHHIAQNDFELDNEELRELFKLNFSDIPKFFDLYHKSYSQNSNFKTSVQLDVFDNMIVLMTEIDLSIWTNPFKITDFIMCYSNLLADGPFRIESKTDYEWGITLFINFEYNYNEPMITAFDNAFTLLNNCFSKALDMMNQEVRSDVFSKSFDFPPEYKNICSQYLTWFGEFLKNLGVEADVYTEANDRQTSLIVSPKDAPELLGEIEKLFYQYLALPYAELLPPQRKMSIPEQHAFTAIKQQVQFMEMQIQSKDSLLLNSNATISSLNTTVATQANLIETQADKLTLINALVDKDKWTNIPFTEGTFKCKNFSKKNMSIQFEPLAIFNKLTNKKPNKDDD